MTRIDCLKRRLWPAPVGEVQLPVYAILDAARDERIYPALLQCSLDRRCLLPGQVPPALARAAPYLVRLEPDNPFTAWLLETGWGASWGIFAAAPTDPFTLQRHLRRFLDAQDERGKRLFFRYYDPRVWRVYLPTCTPRELKALFGPVLRYSCEGESPATMIHSSLASEGVLRHTAWPVAG